MAVTPRQDWTNNELVSPSDMNNIGANTQLIFTPVFDFGTLTSNQTSTTTGTWVNATETLCEITLDVAGRVRMYANLCTSAPAGISQYTVRYAPTSSPTAWVNSYAAIQGSGDDGWLRHEHVSGQTALSFVGITPVLAAGSWRFILAWKQTPSGTQNMRASGTSLWVSYP